MHATTTPDRLDLPDGAQVVPSAYVPGTWVAVLPGGGLFAVPDEHRPGKVLVFRSPDPAKVLAALRAAGHEAEVMR